VDDEDDASYADFGQPEFEEEEDEEEGDLRALPDCLVVEDDTSFVVRKKLVSQLNAALYRTNKVHLRESMDRALSLAGQPSNLDYPVPSLHQTFTSNLSKAGREADSCLETIQQDL
jgi:hypothetical protein